VPESDLVMFHMDAVATTALEPLLRFGEPVVAFATPQPYVDVQRAFDAGLPAGQRWESRAHYLTGLSDETIDALIAGVGDLPGAYTAAYLADEGGEIGPVDPCATAFPHRTASFSVHVLAGGRNPEDDEKVTSWARNFHAALAPSASGGVYVNLLGTDEASRVAAAYGVNYRRLSEIKAKWDPDNLFRMNHNIPPAGREPLASGLGGDT
jgi:hypothetical protein